VTDEHVSVGELSGHLDVDQIADLDAGVLGGRRARRARRHLAGCEECAGSLAALEATTASLRDLGTVAMPGDVAARVQQGLAAAAGETAGETVMPDPAAIRSRRFAAPRFAYAGAAVVVVAGLVVVSLTLARHHHSGTSNNAALQPALVGTASPSAAYVEQQTGRTYTPASLQQLVPGLLAMPRGPLYAKAAPSATAGHNDASGAGAQSGLPAATAPRAAAGGTSETFVPPLAPSLQRLANSRSALLACAAYITDTPNAVPLAVDFGRWRNPATHTRPKPSVIFVFSDPTNSSALTVYVVAPACGGSSLLDYQVVSRR
jgi:hypothetical protein